MAGASEIIEIKKRKLREEKQRPCPNQQIISRLKDSISRHKKEMQTRKRWKARKKHNRMIGRMK